MPSTVPEGTGDHTAPVAFIAAHWEDPNTGAVYVHKDLAQVLPPWKHISPPSGVREFGDVASWVAYVQRFTQGDPYTPLLTWSNGGLEAVLDYHASVEDPGRCQMRASCPFSYSREWEAWTRFSDGAKRTHQQMIEFLEDHADDIDSPNAADLMNLLRGLKVLVNTTVELQRNEDGSQSMKAATEQQIRNNKAGEIGLPAVMTISVPVFKGHQGDDGQPLRYLVRVRQRASVDTNGKPEFRFVMINGDATRDAVVTERVQEAIALIANPDIPLLHAAD